MRTTLACVAISIALCLLAYLALGWGPVIMQQGLAGALTEQSSQPPFLETVACLLISLALFVIGASMAFTRKGE